MGDEKLKVWWEIVESATGRWVKVERKLLIALLVSLESAENEIITLTEKNDWFELEAESFKRHQRGLALEAGFKGIDDD